MGGITIKDIAKVANVSYATVSRALSGKPGIGEDTRAKIKKICDEMGYTPNIMARSLVVKSTNILGIIVPDISNPYFSEMCLHLESYASLKGYSTILCNSRRDHAREESYFKMLQSQQVDGVVFSPFSLDSSTIVSKYAKSVPTVIISDNFSGSGLNCVRVDNYVGAYNGTKHLVSLGHKNIVLFGIRAASVTHTNRTNGYLDAMKEFGLEPSVVKSFYNASSIQNGYLLAKDYFSSKQELPTAIFAINDLVAMGILQAADEYGIKIPEDISLLGFDNIMYSALPKIMLTTVSQPKDEISRATIDLLFSMIGNNKEPATPMDICIKPEVIVRDSCRAI